jgi:hypothetical protein
MNNAMKKVVFLVAIVSFWSPWIFVSWWWAGDVWLSVAVTLSSLINILLTVVSMTFAKWFYSIICHIFAWIVFVLALSACACCVYAIAFFTCPPNVFYVHVVYVSATCVLLFVAAMTLLTMGCLVNIERKRDRLSNPASWDLIAFCLGLRWAAFVFLVALTFTWLPFVWIYPCSEAPLSAICSTVLALTLCLISFTRAVKDHDLFTDKIKRILLVTYYIVTWIVFGTSVYFNHNMWYSQSCHVVTVSFSLVNHVALGVALFLTSVWYSIYACCNTLFK